MVTRDPFVKHVWDCRRCWDVHRKLWHHLDGEATTMSITPVVLWVRTFFQLVLNLMVMRNKKSILLERAVGKGVCVCVCGGGVSQSDADWWEHSPTINVAILLRRAEGKWGAICLLRSGGARATQWCKHLAPINVAILLQRAVGKGGGGVVRGYMHNQIRAGGSHQCGPGSNPSVDALCWFWVCC